MSRILVTGYASGLGMEITKQLEMDGHEVFGMDRQDDWDVSDSSHCKRMAEKFENDPIDVLINCAGVNIIGWLKEFDEADYDLVMGVNAKGIFNMAQAFRPQLIQSKGTILNIVSNAAHMPMRCSAAYNASKAAALMLTKQMARELTDQGITVFSVSPNKLSGTGMSQSIDRQVCITRGWTLEEAQEYQLKGLLTGEETPPAQVAEFIAYLLSSKERHKYLSGCDIPYGL